MKTRLMRLLAVVMAAAMLLSCAPMTVFAESGTIWGDAETIKVSSNSNSARETNFNDDWKFYLGTSSTAQNVNFDDSSWDDVSLPHDFSIFQSFTTSGEAESGFLPGGTGWYRKSFTLPEADAGKSILLNFDGVYMHASVYVNGAFVGEHHYGYTSFAFDISDYVTCDGSTENVIAVKAVNTIPSSRWYSGSGIYRDVTLIVADEVHVDLNGTYVTTPDIASDIGTVQVAVEVVNDGSSDAEVTVTNTVYRKGSSTAKASASSTVTVAAGSSETVTNASEVSSPRLWELDDPELYTVVTELTVDGTVVDTYETEFGFRYFSFDSQGFHLNGENVKLNGVCLHHDQGALGSAAYTDAIYRQLSIMKDMGVNAVRTAHNPADEDFIAICNELGLLVIEEAFDGLNEAKNGNSYDFSTHFEASVDTALYGSTSSMTCAEYAARSMVRRDRNAPAIIAWSFGNELQEGTYWNTVDQFAGFCANFIEWVNQEDGSRPVTSGDNNRGGDSRLVAVIETILDAGGIAGFNYANTASELYSLAQSYGGSNGCIIASETSSHTNSRGVYSSQANNSNADGAYHLTSYDTSAVSWGITAHDSIYNTYQYDCVAGEFIWTGFDYIGEPTPWNGTGTGSVSYMGAYPNSSYFGVVDTAGFVKDTYYLYRSQWNKDETTLHLVTAWDSDNMLTTSGKTPVWVYSNAPVVKLYRDDTLVGTATRVDNTSSAGHTYYTYTTESDNSSICTTSSGSGADGLYAVFNVAYTEGTLSAKAFEADGTTEIALSGNSGKNAVTTPGTVSQLVVSQSETTIDADGESLVYISVDVTDAEGNLDTTAANTIMFSLAGDGEIVGVDNGDQATTAKYQQSSVLTSSTSAQIAAYAGKALVIVRSTKDAGSFTVEVSSSGLAGDTVEVTTTEVEDDAVSEGLVSYTIVRDYTVKEGTTPELQTEVTGELADGSAVSGEIAWDGIDEDVYGAAGDYALSGVLTIDGQEINVSAKLHVIADVIALRNVSTVTTPGVAPSLPAVVNGVLADGTLSGEFTVEWESVTEDELGTVGDIVMVYGEAAIFGSETLAVSCSIRVAEAVNTESSNIAPQVLTLEQDISSSYQSDNLESIIDGYTDPGESTSYRWTNWNNRYRADTATLTLTWATAHQISGVNLYYRYDNSCKYPEAIEFSYSLDGSTYTAIGATASAIDATVSNGAAYSYTFDSVIDPVAIKVTFTQQGGTSGGYCVGLYELEVMTYAASLEANSSADLSAIYADGTHVADFNTDTLSYEASGSEITAETAVNAGITILPAYEGIVRILTVSEDGSEEKSYEIALSEAASCAHANTELRDAKAASCQEAGYTGDIYCTVCETVVTAGEVIEKTAHTTEVINAKAASCSAEGYTGDIYCTVCETVVTAGEVIEKTAHTTEVVNAKAASCTEQGYTGDTYCTVCQQTIETGTAIAVTEHSWDAGVESEGMITYTCTACGGTKTEEVPAELKVPEVTVSATKASSGTKIRLKGQFVDYENSGEYYEVTGHGFVYLTSARLGAKSLTVNTSGRTKVSCTSYYEDGSYVYNMTPTRSSTKYVVRAYLIYTNDSGKNVYVYSDPLTVRYSSLSAYSAN